MCWTFRRAWGRFNVFQQLCFWIAVWKHTAVIFFCHGWTAPNGPGPPDYRRCAITLCLPHSVGIVCAHDRPVAETSTWQHETLTKDIHVLGGIRTHNPSKRMAADPRLRPRCHRDRHCRIIEQTLSKRRYIYVQTPSVLHSNFFLIRDFYDRTELWHAEGTGGS